MAQSSVSFSLFRRESPTTPLPNAPIAPRMRQLWMAVDLPDLAFDRTEHTARAERLGREILSDLAACAHELTSLVSLDWPDGLLLEVQGSLKLFGGLAAVKEKIAAELDRRRMRFSSCAAPTPLAALWLARQAREDVLESSALPGALITLPLATTRWPDDVRTLLAEMGVRAVGDCLRLPRDGFARRIGERYLSELDKALGKQPDLRPQWQSEPILSKVIELVGEVTQTEILASALQTVVTFLASDLRTMQRQVRDVEIVFHHAHRPATREKLQLIEPSHEMRRLLDPLTARLERVILPAPVTALAVSGAPIMMQMEEAELFMDTPGRESVSPAALIENLRARFGVEGVYGLECVNDHRPERVWARLTEELLRKPADGAPCAGAERPLWILPVPKPLAVVGGRSSIAVAACATEAERIESGWWDGGDIRRDYYCVTTAHGQKLWVYQDCVSRGWYLHGIFGSRLTMQRAVRRAMQSSTASATSRSCAALHIPKS